MKEAIKKALQIAVLVYGRDKQIEMAVEEMGELLVAISQYRRGRVAIEAVQEEIADVKIVIGQLSLIFGEDEVNNFESEKLSRLKERVAKHIQLCKTL